MSREVLGTRADAGTADAGAPTVSPTSLDSGGRSWRGATTGSLTTGRATTAASGAHAVGTPSRPDTSGTGTARTDTGDGTWADDDPPLASGPGRHTPGEDDAATPPSPWTDTRRRLVAVAVVAAVVGALLGVAVVQRSELRRAQSTADVQAWVESAPNRGSADAIALTLHVVNTGDAPVVVVGAAMNAGQAEPGPVSVALAEDVTVRPGTLATVDVDAQSDCEGAPLASGSSRDGRLQLRVRTDDGREQLVDPPRAGISLTSADVQELYCGQAGTRLGLTVAAIQPRPAGELSMSLLNDSPTSLTLDFSAPEGTRVVSDRELPTTITSGLRSTLVISLEVDDCTNNAQRVQAGDDVQLVIDGRPRRGGLDSSLIDAWVAQQVALACS